MDRSKRAATKVTDFFKYHLLGDLDTHLVGRVDDRIHQFEMSNTTEELQKQLEEERENSRRLQGDLEAMRIRNELEMEKQKQKQWETAKQQLQEVHEQAEREHYRALEEMTDRAEASNSEKNSQVMEWFKAQLLGRYHRRTGQAPTRKRQRAGRPHGTAGSNLQENSNPERATIHRQLPGGAVAPAQRSTIWETRRRYK